MLRKCRHQLYPLLLQALGASLAVLLMVDIVLSAFQYSLVPPETHLDGPYQFYSSLLWHNSALVYGRDYLTYLGWGLISAADLIFGFTNQSFGASLFTDFVFHGLLFCLGLLLVLKAFYRSNTTTLLWLVFFLLLAKYTEQAHLSMLLHPDHSALGARMSIAAICLFGVYHLSNSSHSLAMFACCLLLGLTPLWSNDMGPIAAFYGALLFVLLSRDKPWRILWVGIGAALTLVGAGLVITQGHVVEFLARTLGVSEYQYWYFEGYAQEDHIYTWAELIHRLGANRFARNGIILIVVTALTSMVLAARGKQTWPRYLALTFWLLALLSGAIVLEVFGHVHDRYYYGLDLAVCVSVFILLSQLVTLLWSARKTKPKWTVPALPILLLVASLVFLADVSRSLAKVKNARSPVNCVFSTGGCDREWLNGDTAALVDTIKQSLTQNLTPTDERLIGEYYTTISDQLQVVPALPSALAIHALGDIGRAEWIAALDDTPFQYALTTKPELSEYQFWSLHQQWWFYRRVIGSFDPIYSDQQYVIWARRSGGERHFLPVDTSCSFTRLAASKWLFELSKADDQYLYEVVIRTDGELAERAFLRLSWQNYAAVTTKPDFGSVAMDREIRFPFQGGAATLSMEIIGPDAPSSFRPESCNMLATPFLDKSPIYRRSMP